MNIISYENLALGKLRLIEIDDQPWFVATDVLSALRLRHPERTVSRWVDEEDRILYNLQGTAHSGKRGNPNVVLVNESGLYSLIFASKTEFAKEFKHWVTSVVLPSLRKHGYYICPEAQERAEAVELVLSGYDQLRPEKARILKSEMVQSLKEQVTVHKAENRRLKRSLQDAEDRDLEKQKTIEEVKNQLLKKLLAGDEV